AHGAADAAVVHLEHFFVRADHQVVVDPDLAELVHDHGILLAVVFGEHAVEKGGFARAEVTGQDGDGDLFGGRGFGHGNLERRRRVGWDYISVATPQKQIARPEKWARKRRSPIQEDRASTVTVAKEGGGFRPALLLPP